MKARAISVPKKMSGYQFYTFLKGAGLRPYASIEEVAMYPPENGKYNTVPFFCRVWGGPSKGFDYYLLGPDGKQGNILDIPSEYQDKNKNLLRGATLLVHK